MKGGSIIGQGGYGCAFRPALLCRGLKNGKAKVGKITSHEDANNELKVARYLKTLPDSEKYAVFAESSCVPRALSKQQEADINKCQILEKLDIKDTIQILMPYGGSSLNRINLHPSQFNFFKCMEGILMAGVFFLKNDLCHFDISERNIVVDKHTSARFIDFGFSFRPSKLDIEDIILRFREIDYNYDPESPEVTLMLASESKISISEAIYGLKKYKPAVLNLVNLCGVNKEHWANELREWSNNSESFKSKSWLASWKTYWPGFDAWAIGALLLYILEIQMSFPEFASSSMWKTRGHVIKKVLIGMCRANPIERLDAVDALKLFND